VCKRNPSDGNPSAGRTDECSNGLGERSAGLVSLMVELAAQVWHAAGEPGARRWIEPGVAEVLDRCSKKSNR